MSQNGTGIIYPEIELGGKTYVVRFDKEVMVYRLSKANANFADLVDPRRRFAAMFDILYAAISDQYVGTPESLSVLAQQEDKVRLVDQVVAEGIKKVFPTPIQAPAAAESGAPPVN
jgi:hypothetical protein